MHKPFITSFFTLLLISTTLFTALHFINPVSAATRRVPQDYPTIQSAINAARKGDTIQVSPGTYYENVIIPTNKEILLTGLNKDTTIIDGRQQGNVVYVQSSTPQNPVRITGFTIRNGDNGIRVAGSIGNVEISGNIIKNNRYGVSLIGDETAATTDNTIVDNTFQNNSNVSVSISYGLSTTISQNIISGSANGMKIYVTNSTTISYNTLNGNAYAIYISRSSTDNVLNNILTANSYGIYTAYSDHITINDNKVTQSTTAIQIYGGFVNTVQRNNASDNPIGYSIYLAHTHTNNLVNNTVSTSDWGLTLYNSTGNTVTGNTISYNTFGTTFTLSPTNTLYHNNIINNVDQVTRDSASGNYWSSGGQGNHWSDYHGLDNGAGGRTAGDGIGDTLIPHLGEDNYPLMNPWPNAKPDVAVLAIYESTSIAYIGQVITFEVIVKNEGPAPITFNVTLQNNVTQIEEKTVTNLASNTNASVFFNWNTQTVPAGYYQFSATADQVPNEVDFADNSKDNGVITLKSPLLGDINKDFIVDSIDLDILEQSYGYASPDPNYNPEADLNTDSIVNAVDLLLLSKNYGKTA